MQRRVMLWGLRDDAPFAALERELTLQNVTPVLIDQRRLAEAGLDLEISQGLCGRLTLAGDSVDIADIRSIYASPRNLREALPLVAAEDAEVLTRAEALESRLYAWIDIAEALVVNRPSAMISNSSKPQQLETIREHGFAVPETLVTTSPGAARAFMAEHGAVICKSTSSMRSIVTRVDKSQLQRLRDITHCPTQFQSYVAGTDWRVHIIGDEVMACEIRCAADDYRFAQQRGDTLAIRAAELPEAIATRCRTLAHDLGLAVSGIDLRRTDDDEWYGFEVNPVPAFTWYEELCGQPLTAAVARLLIDAGRA